MIYWHSWSEFIHMGGYGVYVWGSLGIMALVMAAEVWQIRTRRRRLG
ncbi:MAG: heme exporter protein CcmD [Comamonas sp.]|nr:heme exporter protein CcmD [Comamonas sp.]